MGEAEEERKSLEGLLSGLPLPLLVDDFDLLRFNDILLSLLASEVLLVLQVEEDRIESLRFAVRQQSRSNQRVRTAGGRITNTMKIQRP